MKVTVSVGGRFHAFDLAAQLNKRGFMYRLVTAYPKFFAKKWGVESGQIRSVLIKELMERAWRKLPGTIKNRWNPENFICETYDKLASRKIGSPDLFVGWSSFSLHSLRRAKSGGALIVIEHGSSHILYQNEILKEEYSKLGVKIDPFMLPHPKIIEKELKEYSEADYISVPSHFVKKTFLEKGVPETKLIHVPYGVDLGAFKQIPKEDKKFRVIFVGAMTIRKGVHYLLQAFVELNLPNSELMLVGPMSEQMDLFFKKYAGKFNYIGRVPQKELYKYYSQGSVFVMASIEEGLAMVQAQAMACGLPVICTANTGGGDIVRDGMDGFVIPIRDVEKLKEKIVYLYKNPEICRQMGKSAKERVSSGFTWNDYGDKIVKEYERILKEK